MAPLYRFWLHSLYGLHELLSDVQEKPLNLITLSLSKMIMDVIIYPCWDYSSTMLVKGAPGVLAPWIIGFHAHDIYEKNTVFAISSTVLKARPNFQVANWATWKPLQVVQLMTR